MKLLLVLPSEAVARELCAFFAAEKVVHPVSGFLHQAKLLHHEVDLLIATGFSFSLSYHLAKIFALQKYHLAIKLSLASAYSNTTFVGTVLNVVNEKPGDAGEQTGEEWQDIYDLKRLDRQDMPHVRGGFVNMTNAYMNVFMPFKKVVGLTVNQLGRVDLIGLRKERYKAEVETADGLAFVYTCLAEQQTYYHLALVDRNLAAGVQHSDSVPSGKALLVDLIQKL